MNIHSCRLRVDRVFGACILKLPPWPALRAILMQTFIWDFFEIWSRLGRVGFGISSGPVSWVPFVRFCRAEPRLDSRTHFYQKCHHALLAQTQFSESCLLRDSGPPTFNLRS